MSRDVYTDHEITNLRLDGIEDQLVRIGDTLERISATLDRMIPERAHGDAMAETCECRYHSERRERAS